MTPPRLSCEHPDLHDLVQAADDLQCSRKTLYRARRRGRLTFTYVESSPRIRRAELDRYLRASERGRAA